MADTAVLRVDVASADFDKFQATFNAYAKTLEQTLATWGKITSEVKAASAAMTNMAAPVARSTASLQKFTSQFAETAKHTASIRSNVESITKGLVSWRTAVGTTLGLLGIGGGLAGLNALISGAVADRNRALAQGVGYGTARGMGTGALPGGGAMMAGWGQARWDPTSGAYRGAQTIFGSDTNRQLARTDPQAMVDALNKATTYLGQFDEKLRGTIATTTGLNDFLGTEALRTWTTLTDQAKAGNVAAKEELAARVRAYTAAGEAAKQAEEGVRKWSTFYVTLESTRSVIQDTLIDKLSPLAPQLTKLSEGMNTAVAAFLTAPAVQEAITDLAKSIGDFAKYLNSPEAREAIKGFTDSMASAYHTLKDINDKFMAIQQWLSDHSLMKGMEWLQGKAGTQPPPTLDLNAPPKSTAIGRWLGLSKAPATPGNAAWTPAPTVAATALGGQDSRMGEQMMQWFGQESQATQKAADAAERRDTKLERLLTSMEKWFQGGQELKQRTLKDVYNDASALNLGGSSLLPPWMRGVANTLKSTPADTGELSPSMFPGGAGANAFAQGIGGAAAPGASQGIRMRTTRYGGGAGGAATGAGLGPIQPGEHGFLKQQEGLSLKAYNDVGHQAIGYGHDFTPQELAQGFALGANGEHIPTTGTISKDQANSLFQADYASREGQVAKLAGAGFSGLGTNQKEAIMSYYYNTGRLPANLAQNIQAGNMAGIQQSLRSGISTVHGQTFAPLVKRRAQEAALFGTADSSAPTSSNSVAEIRGPNGSNAPDANALLAEVKKTHPHFTNEQCVTLVREYTGMGGTVKDWRKGQNVMSGNMKVGTPIATFMSSSGQQSERYDAGGIGTPGAGTSHAALFGGYTRDEAGKITGINVVEQYKYSGRKGQVQGPHVQHYGIGGFGERGAENYYGVAMGGQGQKSAGGLDNDNWQQKPINHVQVHNKSGSDVHIAASTVMTSV